MLIYKRKRAKKKNIVNFILSINEINYLESNLIKQHIEKPFSFHIDNLKILFIYLLIYLKLKIYFKNFKEKKIS